MCQAGIPVLEVYPMTASYPDGTLDHVHYSANVQRAAEDQLLAFIMEKMKKTSRWRDQELTDGESSHGLYGEQACRGARVARWWEHSPPTNVARVQIPASTPYVCWVCCWFSPLLQEVFLRVLRFSPLLKNQHFQIPVRPGIRQTKNHYVDVLPANRYLFLFIYLTRQVYKKGETVRVFEPLTK